MATIQGNGGAVAFGSGFTGWNAFCSGWSLDIDIESVDNTTFGGLATTEYGYRHHDPVIVSATGSLTGRLQAQISGANDPIGDDVLDEGNDNNADPTAAKGTLTLTAESGNLYAMSAVITSVSISRANDGPSEVTYAFSSSGAITQTWS